MRVWLYMLLAVLFTMTLNGCDPFDDEQGQTVSQLSQQPSLKKPHAKESALNDEEPMSRLDNTLNANVKEIEWDALIPEDWRPDVLIQQYNIDDISDDDPRAQQLLEKIKALWKEAPVVPEFDGQQIKLPGFVVPLEMDTKKITQFLLVPYYGACIHVPPPPANQTIYVVIREGETFDGQLFDTVWVTGTMRVERLSSELAEAGYRLEQASVVPYE